MKTYSSNYCSILISVIIVVTATTYGQGTINFDAHNNWIETNYTESSMAFHLVIPQGSSIDYFGITYGAGNTPSDGTPYMQWFRQNNPYNYVSLSLTNGSMFGLTSVWLADPTAPSPSPVIISFVGYLAGGGSVTNTFTTPGNGATTFATYLFNSSFTSGLTSVDIFASRWAMDNLVFTVPEPSAISFILLGGWVFIYVRARRK